MVYLPITIDFWHVVLKCLGGPALHLFSGPCGRGIKTFNPKDYKINFAVPSWYTLQSRTKDIPKLIFPSIFQDVLSTLEVLQHANNLQYVLSYDGKNVSQGFRGVNFGDIDLWGCEGPPSLKDHEQRLNYNLSMI